VNLALGDLQLSPVTGKPVAGEAVPKPVQAAAKAEEVAKTKPQEPAPQNSKKLTADSTDMSYSVDSTASAFTIKITNKSTGEVIRKLDFKGFSPDVHLTSKLTGTLVDVKG
jgi:FlaG protein